MPDSSSDSPSVMRLPTSMYLLALLTLGAALYLGYQMGVNSDPAEALRTQLAACLAAQVAPVDPNPASEAATAAEPVSADVPAAAADPHPPTTLTASPSEN